ncbi:MAG: MEDS domain-containing protein [Chloroflexota bacterium]|nr:MEDS domain-containing protein [Chloroflexota bacterium]
MQEKLRKTGIDVIGDVPWGSHFCQFYQSKADLLDILVPYFQAGLENGEAGMWVTSAPLTVADAKRALKRAVPDLPKYLAEGRMEIVPYTDWCMKDGYFDLDRVLNGWAEKLNQALARGFEGLRVTGNTAWLERKDWDNFAEYEAAINGVIGKYRLLALCTYWLDRCTATDVMDVIRNHEFALICKEGKWELIENAVYKRAKQGLLESEQKFRSLYFTMSEGVCLHEIIYDESGKAVDYRILDVNPAYESITGLKRERVIGRKASELYGTGEPPYLEIYAGVASARKPVSFETYFPPMQKHFNISVFSPEQGKFATVFSDITERKQAEQALRENEEELSTILAGVPLLMLVVDSERHVLNANAAAVKFVGRGLKGMVGARAGEALRCLHSLDDPRGCGFGSACQNCKTRLTLLDTFETGSNHYQVEWHLPLSRNGKPEEVTFLLSTVLLNTSRKQVLLCIEDITERKRAEEEVKLLNESLRQRTMELEAINRELEAFGYSVSHDLRAPLRSMAGFSHALVEDYSDKLDERGKDFLRRIQASSHLMAQLIDDLLGLSRVTRSEIRWETVNISKLAQTVADDMKRNEPERQVEVNIAPGLQCYGDGYLLRLVFDNLIGNAWKFTGKRSSAKIEFGARQENGQTVYFVRDNGAGFDMAYADKLFKPFQRLHTSSQFVGSGIGLATVQRIVNRLGGRVWAESKLDQGATFYFTLGK